MAKVSVCWHSNVPGKGWRYETCKWAKGLPLHGEHPGKFVLRQYDSQGRKVYTQVFPDNQSARLADDCRRLAQRASERKGKAPVGEIIVSKAATAYIEHLKRMGHNEAANNARLTLDEFVPLCPTPIVLMVNREMVTKYIAKMRERGLAERTIHTRFVRLKSFLRFSKVPLAFLDGVKVQYEQKEVDTYTREQVDNLLGLARGSLKLALEMAYMLGLRFSELIHAEWGDVNWEAGVYRVTSKSHYGFKIKDKEQRSITIPTPLLDHLRAHKEKSRCRLIVPTKNGKPNQNLLVSLKRLARRAGLNCGHCAGCMKHTDRHQECRQFTLHKWRRSALTTLLRNDVDVRTVQGIAGHSSLKTTLKYLEALKAGSPEMRSKVDAVKW
jgi:integrase/recombinase XerD